jgi:pimeloyl-ACP methyl ester carboxylesterase
MLRLLAGEWLAFSLTHSLLQPLRPLWRRWLDQPVAAVETGALVVFVHGYCCNAAFWLPMRRRLAGQGVGCQAGIDLEPVFGDIDCMADQLAARLRALRNTHGGRRCIVVAHSMGGLVARSALRRHGSSIMDELITIGTPHGGSRLARLAPGINADQMRPDSAWLQALNDEPASHSVPVTAIASRDDELVAPWQSALPDFAIRRVELTEVGHLALGYSPRVAEMIRQAATAP